MRQTPLEAWMRERIAPRDLPEWQLEKLRETVARLHNSPFYRERLAGLRVDSLDDLRRLPFTRDDDIIREDTRFLCVSPKEISRIVTMYTSGTTQLPKRIYFTEDDQELTLDFFARGLPTLAPEGETMAVLLPCQTPGGVGDLIARSLERIPVTAVRHGLATSLPPALEMLEQSGAQSLVGLPVQVLALFRYSRLMNRPTRVRRVLLSADNIPRPVVDELNAGGWEVFIHYGMTEMGLGGAIDCDAHVGQHIRENDLLVEIIDPDTGLPLPDGQWGEVVFTTLTRRGMPLLRYRTGDISRIVPGPCPCGCVLRRLDDVTGKYAEVLDLGQDRLLKMADLDDALFALPQILDFRAEARRDGERLGLRLLVSALRGLPPLAPETVREALAAVDAFGGGTELDTEVEVRYDDDFPSLHQGKRQFIKERQD